MNTQTHTTKGLVDGATVEVIRDASYFIGMTGTIVRSGINSANMPWFEVQFTYGTFQDAIFYVGEIKLA